MVLLTFLACEDDKAVFETEGFTSEGSYYVSYDTDPTPIPLNTPFVLGVEVYTDDSKSTPVSDITVDVDAEMPAHGHGMNVSIDAEDMGEGRFEAEGFLFHMSGYWEIIVYVNGEDGSEDIRFPVSLE